MAIIHDWINEAAASLRLPVERISPDDASSLFSRLREKFADPGSRQTMWGTFKQSVGRRIASGWQQIGDYVGDSPCILVVEDRHLGAYGIRDGRELTRILAECPGFEFYVTNASCDYVLCHNHHDYLIGAGQSVGWLSGLSDDA